MKRITLVSLASFGFLALCSLVEYIARGIIKDQVEALLIGLGVLILSGAAVLFAGERIWMNSICFTLSSIAMGLLLRAWYINRGFENSLPTMLLVSLCAVLYLWLFYAVSRIPVFRESRGAYIAFSVIFALLSGGAYLVVMLTTETTFVSTFGYFMIIELAFIFAMSLEVHSGRELFHNLTLSTFSVFLVALGVLIAVILALVCGEGGDCDCDCDCECFECACDSLDIGHSTAADSAKRKRNRKK